MRAQEFEGAIKLWLSARETSDWAEKWPCSSLGGHRVFAEFAKNGDLIDLAIDGRSDSDCDGHEFNCLTSDFLRKKFPDHPAIKA